MSCWRDAVCRGLLGAQLLFGNQAVTSGLGLAPVSVCSLLSSASEKILMATLSSETGLCKREK